MGTILVGAILAGIVALIIRSMIHDKKMENPFNAAGTAGIAVVIADITICSIEKRQKSPYEAD